MVSALAHANRPTFTWLCQHMLLQSCNMPVLGGLVAPSLAFDNACASLPRFLGLPGIHICPHLQIPVRRLVRALCLSISAYLCLCLSPSPTFIHLCLRLSRLRLSLSDVCVAHVRRTSNFQALASRGNMNGMSGHRCRQLKEDGCKRPETSRNGANRQAQTLGSNTK